MAAGRILLRLRNYAGRLGDMLEDGATAIGSFEAT